MNQKTVCIATVVVCAVAIYLTSAAPQEERHSLRRSHLSKNDRRDNRNSESAERQHGDQPRVRHRRVRLKQSVRNKAVSPETQLNNNHVSNGGDNRDMSSQNMEMLSKGSEHEPLYGSKPPIVEEPENQQFWESDASHTPHHPQNDDPHNLLYSDHAPQPVMGDRSNNLDDRLNSNSAAAIPARRRGNIHQIADSLDGLSSEQLFPDKSDYSEFSYDDNDLEGRDLEGRDIDIDMTTQGQDSRSSELVENRSDLEMQGSWEDTDFLKDLVLDLRDQLRESRTDQHATRSVINTLEEKQAAQATDLQILKDQVLRIRQEQVNQQQVLTGLQEQVSNNAWGVSDIKDMNDQMTHDFGALKSLQLAHNDTMILLSDLSESSLVDHEEHASAIRHLQHEVLRMRTQQEQDGDLIMELQEAIKGGNGGEMDEEEEDVRGGEEFDDSQRRFHNSIPVIPTLIDTSRENSGVGSNSQEFQTFDELASSIEEKHNVIGDHITRIVELEARMEQDLLRMRAHFRNYESRFSNLDNSILNLSLALSNAERQILSNQNHDITTQLMNFTEQLMHLQHWHMTSQSSANTTWSNQQLLVELENVLDRHARRIDLLEERSERAREHRSRTVGNVEGLEEKVSRVENKLQRNEGKLAQMQIQVLNASLGECEQASGVLKLELQLQELDTGLTKVEKRLDTSADKTNKIERGVGKLFELSDKQGHALSRLVSTVEEVGTVLPAISGLQVDVQNLLSELPRDCNDILLSDPNAPSGVYLLHAQGSATSMRLPCDFEDDDTAWTVLQRRMDGNTSFARDWDDYKYGFGDPSSEFWIGNDHLHFLTSQDNYQLQIDMIDLYDRYTWARYDVFTVANQDAMYALELSGYQGNATDALQYSNHMPFSTVDRDNDVSSTNCAKFYTAGWWYKHCHYANLNGRYTVGIVWFDHNEDQWSQKKMTAMKIRPLKRQHSVSEDTVGLDN